MEFIKNVLLISSMNIIEGDCVSYFNTPTPPSFYLSRNGGMCMHDEAAPHYIDMIDQTTLGHRFLKEEFDVTPRIGWQIDPFGHTAVQAYLLGAEVQL